MQLEEQAKGDRQVSLVLPDRQVRPVPQEPLAISAQPELPESSAQPELLGQPEALVRQEQQGQLDYQVQPGLPEPQDQQVLLG